MPLDVIVVLHTKNGLIAHEAFERSVVPRFFTLFFALLLSLFVLFFVVSVDVDCQGQLRDKRFVTNLANY